MVDATGTWTIAYAASIVLLLVGALLAFLLHPDVSFMEEPWGDPVPPKQAAEVSVEAAHARIVEM